MLDMKGGKFYEIVMHGIGKKLFTNQQIDKETVNITSRSTMDDKQQHKEENRKVTVKSTGPKNVRGQP